MKNTFVKKIGIILSVIISVSFFNTAVFADNESDNIAIDKCYVWKPAIFGSNSLGTLNEGVGKASYINVNYKDGKSAGINGEVYNVKPELMENGKLTNIDSVNVVSWYDSGKVTGDNDGIAYYYTRVNADNNFILSADVTVNRYMKPVDEMEGPEKAYYESLIESGDTPAKAMDKMRTGQEAFGIMARDIVPFAGGLDESGEYIGNSISKVAYTDDCAMIKTYNFTDAAGKEISVDAPVDLIEAKLNNYIVTDKDGKEYKVSNESVNLTSTSNVVIAGAGTNSTWPSEGSFDYDRRTRMNRINLIARTGINNYTGSGGERVGLYPTTYKVPEAGDKYHITLSKFGNEYIINTYDYSEDETITKYLTSDDIERDLLQKLDADDIYVGFFAARWADCTVSDISLYETKSISAYELFQNSPKKGNFEITNRGWCRAEENGEIYAQSSNNADDTNSVISLKVEGSCVLYYEMAVSSEEEYDTFTMKKNGESVADISGENIYTLDKPYKDCIVLGEGENEVVWEYSKDSSNSVGQDCAWLKNLRIADIGDTDLDGSLDLTDAILCQKYISDNSAITDVLGKKTADYNCDGVIDSKDSAYMLRALIDNTL